MSHHSENIENAMQNISNILEGDYLDKINNDVLELTQLVHSTKHDTKHDTTNDIARKLSHLSNNIATLNEEVRSLRASYKEKTINATNIKTEIEDWIATYLPQIIDQMVENKMSSLLNK